MSNVFKVNVMNQKYEEKPIKLIKIFSQTFTYYYNYKLIEGGELENDYVFHKF